MTDIQQTCRNVTEQIVARHGYKNIYEFEYELEKGNLKCLRIWLGRRTKKTLRVIELTEQDRAEVSPVLEQMKANKDEAFDYDIRLPKEFKDWIDGMGEAARARLLHRLLAEADARNQ